MFFCGRNEEGEEQLRLRRLQLPFTFTTGEAMLYDVAPAIAPPDPCSAPKQRKLDGPISPNSILGCMMNQDQSLYHNNNNTITSIDDLAFKDTHATLSVPGDLWLDATFRNMTGSLMKSEATVQDMMDTLKQILGGDELADSLEVEPEELKSWESTLLKLSSSCELGDDLCNILSNDVLMYVQEQLQREGLFKTPDQLDEIPPCLDLPGQIHQNFGWTGEPHGQLPPSRGQLVSQLGAPVCGTMKLTHVDLPQVSSAGLDAPALQLISFQQSSGLQPQSCTQDQPRVTDGDLGAFPRRRTPANQNHCPQMAQPIQKQPAGVQEPDNVFLFQGNGWSSKSSPVDHFVDSYADQISSQRGFAANGCLQGHFGPRDQSSDHQKQSWSLDQRQLHLHASDGPRGLGARLHQRNLRHAAVNGRSLLKSCQTPSVPYAAQHSGTSSTCMFSSGAASTPSCQSLNPTGNQITSNTSCLYGGLPGGGAVPGMTSVLNPDETSLSRKPTVVQNPEDLLVQPQPYLHVSDNRTQVRAEKTPAQSCTLQLSNGFLLL